ncbi:galactokinase [Microbacterium suaedae]|uniref:galactokinase n=1 Tax=Microbacterium suaedae TaxID=2067813 RepID=UPI0018E06CD9|nr:galactokinase [Microbacterium suaedae]
MTAPTRTNDLPTPLISPIADRAGTARALAGIRLDDGERAGGVWSAPGRVNLIGEHIDYADGMCLPIAIPQRTFARVYRRDDGMLHLSSSQETTVTSIASADIRNNADRGWHRYVLGVLWSMSDWPGAADIINGGLDIHIDGHVPYGSGLSSSAALECAVAVAVAELAGTPFDGSREEEEVRRRLATYTIRAENQYVGAPTGGLDQSASLRCKKDEALHLDCASWSTQSVPIDMTGADLVLLVINTNVSHSHADGGYGDRRRSIDSASERLGVPSLRHVYNGGQQEWALEALRPAPIQQRRVAHVLTEMERTDRAVAALRDSDWTTFGTLMRESHASLRDDFEVSCDELDTAVQTAIEEGAIGARMTGGGFGGSAIALVPARLTESIAKAITARFEREPGWASPDFYIGTPSDGAGRDL